jgi:colicin import membrane protein
MTERTSDRWVSIVLSVLLHGALLAALVFGWWTYRQKTQAVTPTLAIEAAVVDSKSVKGASAPIPNPPAPAPTPPPAPAPAQPPPPEPQPAPPVEDQGPPEPTPEDLAQRAQQQKEQEQRAAEAAQRKEDERKAQQQAQQQADEKHAEQERQAQQKAEAERKAKADAEAKKRAEEQRLAQQKKLEDQKRQAQEAQDRAQTESDLKRSLEAEERATAARSSGALANWQAQIQARIQRAWLRPPTARAGLVCELDVTQVPGGEVTDVKLGACNGDQAVRDSIVAAVYRASPLPPPPDPSLFERELQITFRPSE